MSTLKPCLFGPVLFCTLYIRVHVPVIQQQYVSHTSKYVRVPTRIILHVSILEMLPFYQLREYSRVLPGLLIPVTGTSNTSYSPCIWAPGTRVPGYSLVYVGNPGHGNWSSPKSRPLGSISYGILQETLFKMKMLSHASRGVRTLLPITLVIASITRLADTRHGYE